MKKTKWSIAPSLVSILLLVLLAVTSAASLWSMPSASALGCAPLSLRAEGPYRSSVQGVAGFDNKTIAWWVEQVYIVELGSTLNMTFNVIYDMEGLSETRTILPHLTLQGAPLDASWLSVSFSPNTIVMAPYQERANVTVTLNVSKDAPLASEYGLNFAVSTPSGGKLCLWRRTLHTADWSSGSCTCVYPLLCPFNSKLRWGKSYTSHN